MSRIPTIINYYGGKQKLARQIISVMPSHEHYIEVFCGGAAVFFNKSKSPRNCLNDFNGNLTNLYIQVRDNFEELAKKVYWTIYSREQYEKFYRLHDSGYKNCSDVDKALSFLFLIRASFNSQITTDFSASIDSNSANFNIALIERLEAAREKLDSVVIENRSFAEIIPKYDVKGSFFYLDPPYYVTCIDKQFYYEKTMSEFEHGRLAHLLADCKSPWILSYDDLPEVLELYKDFQIQRLSVKYSTGVQREIHTKAGERTKKISELLITNYKCKKPQLDMYDENPDLELDEIRDEERLAAEIHVRIKAEIEDDKLRKETRERPGPDKPTIEQGNLFNS